MTLSTYELNATYQKTSLQYDAKITPVSKESIENKAKEEDEYGDIIANTPVLYTNTDSLSDPQKFQKLLMDKILGGFSLDSNPKSLFPQEGMNVENESYNNPYTKNTNSLPQGLLYTSSSEYYEKTSIEFNFEAKIKTPNGEYNIEINFSYTQEFYEKNETQVAIANENFKQALEIELDKDDENLKDLKSLHFIFDVYNEQKEDDNKDIFEQLKEILAQRRESMIEMFKKDENENEEKGKTEKGLDNFQIWQETSNQEMSLIAAQKDGIGVFLANSNSETSFLNLNVNPNGYSLEASYSSSQTSFAQISNE